MYNAAAAASAAAAMENGCKGDKGLQSLVRSLPPIFSLSSVPPIQTALPYKLAHTNQQRNFKILNVPIFLQTFPVLFAQE
ncbi:hypothetical protein TWF506_004993 [Arthrobotrys conoides]|uniref:Uncharacterized protein n=1 Tax=Arthrobotrys conoides TaxID=74498 RepID=A0AAN8NT84_9PEZI